MRTEVLQLDPQKGPWPARARAARLVDDGGLVAFPTETVYGIAVNLRDEAAVRRLYQAKGRDEEKPLTVHLPAREAIEPLVKDLPRAAVKLAARFWPGPLTIVVADRHGRPTGYRVPDLAVAQELLRLATCRVGATSANPSGAEEAVTAEEVMRHFDGVVDLVVDGGRCRGVVALEVATGRFVLIEAGAVVIATGGAGRVFRENTNGGIVTGDGMALAYRHGVPLRDMEFMQYHPTCMPGTGLLFTEACRGEGGILTNKDGYRYLQDYGLGPADPWPRKKAMELGPRDRLSQAFWHEDRKGRTVQTPHGSAVNLDLRHLGHKKLRERLPLICELAEEFLGIDPALAPIPVRPAVHYTMGGILVDGRTAAPLPGLYAAGECSSVGIHGANRLGSNSLAELSVFGRVAGEEAARYARSAPRGGSDALARQAADAVARATAVVGVRDGTERLATVRREMAQSMENGCGIYRTGPEMQTTCDNLAELRERYRRVRLDDTSTAWNTEWLNAIELGYQLEVAQAIAHSALNRQESRGAHQRIDGFEKRDDVRFLKHTLARYDGAGPPRIEYGDVKITRSPPGTRAYGAAGEHAEAAMGAAK